MQQLGFKVKEIKDVIDSPDDVLVQAINLQIEKMNDVIREKEDDRLKELDWGSWDTLGPKRICI